MKRLLSTAYEPYAEVFISRDDYKRVKGVEPPPYDMNRPIQEWIDGRPNLPKLVSYPRTIQTSEISGKIIYDDTGHAIIDGGILLRNWAQSPNFLPREPLVDYGPLGKLRSFPPIIELKAGQFIGFDGFAEYFEDGVKDGGAPAVGGFTEADRNLLLLMSGKLDKIIAGK